MLSSGRRLIWEESNHFDSYLSDGLQVSGWLQLVDTMTLGFAISAALVNWSFATSTAYANAVDEEALLCTISQATCLVWSRWTWCAVQLCQLTVLPASHAEQVAENVALLFAIQLLNVSVCTHFR
jgi:hypothetical protein